MPSVMSNIKPRESPNGGHSTFQVMVIVMCVIVIQRMIMEPMWMTTAYNDLSLVSDEPRTMPKGPAAGVARHSPLAVPIGGTVNLPSIRVTDDQGSEDGNVDGARKIYGGKGDKQHLGGFTEIDMNGISPATWKHAVEKWTVQSVLDVGCGRGISTSWFVTHGLRTECVEGSHDAILQSMVPDKSILTEHDFSRGPWWPSETFDMVWSVEFLEHVNLQFHYNYVSAFRKAAILLVTSSRWGGWHHVEVHPDEWWIRKYEAYGFRYDEKLTEEMRTVAREEKFSGETFPPTGERYSAQHIYKSLKVFINPEVAALPEHAHLFGEFGCFVDTKNGKIVNRECGKALSKQKQKAASRETPLDPEFYPLPLDKEMDQDWYDIVQANIQVPEKKK